MKISDLVKKSLTPFIYISLTAMILTGPWLVYKGALSAIWPAVLGLVASPVLFPVLLLPGGIMAGIMNMATKSHPRLADVMTISSICYLILLLSFYEMWSLRFLSPFMTGQDLLPAVLWGVFAGMAPWAIHAAKDRDNIFFTGLILMTVCIAPVIVFLGSHFELGFWSSFLAFFGIMAALVGIEAVVEGILLKRRTSINQ